MRRTLCNCKALYAPSFSTLHFVRLWQATRVTPEKEFWGIGDPIYQPANPRCRGAARPSGPADPAIVRRRASREFARLPGAGVEVERLRELWASTPGDIIVGPAAMESAVKALSSSGELARYRYVHFATHGVLGLDKESQPALVLGLVDDRHDDGFLELDEVTGLRLNADLVVLSACQSAQGESRKAEGISGLARAFFYAGSRGVVCSLWQVNDQDASEMMVDFYTGLKARLSAADALRQAKRKRIASRRPPWSWAPFILIGE